MDFVKELLKFLDSLFKPKKIEKKEEDKKPLKRFKKKTNKQITKNFNSDEFDCKCSDFCYETILDIRLVHKLQLIREKLGLPLIITSAYRCYQHNKNVGGSPTSTHQDGIAVDLWCEDLDKLAAVIEELFPEHSIGRYNNFLHFDLREDGRRWDYRKQY